MRLSAITRRDEHKYMNTIKIGKMKVSEISLGCMRISNLPIDEISHLLETAIESGIDFFDHADIYGGGNSEKVFAKAMQASSIKREDIVIQSKCGIRNGCYDFSKEHILNSVDGSLKRLNTEYLDVLLLHRPDTLMEPEEVAEAFDILHDSGKVKYFGVSNHNPMQIKLLNQCVDQKLIINQLQMSVTHTGMIDSGLNVNMRNDMSVDRDGSILEYCRIKNITIQPWSPFQHGFFGGIFLDNNKYPELNQKIDEIAEKYNVTNSAIAIAWLLRHPAKMQPIVGTTNAKRLKDICKASEVQLSREEWYEIYRAAGNNLP